MIYKHSLVKNLPQQYVELCPINTLKRTANSNETQNENVIAGRLITAQQ